MAILTASLRPPYRLLYVAFPKDLSFWWLLGISNSTAVSVKPGLEFLVFTDIGNISWYYSGASPRHFHPNPRPTVLALRALQH